MVYRSVSTKLTPGTYAVGAAYNNPLDPLIFRGTLAGEGISNVNGANITLIQNQFIAGGTLTDPTFTAGDTMSYFGANFAYSTSTVPEPGTIVMLGTGLLGLAGALRRKISL